LLPVNFYFDEESGLLVRWVRWNQTPLAPVPTAADYDDYRDVAGVKMPFKWTVSQTYMQMKHRAERRATERVGRRGTVRHARAGRTEALTGEDRK
jgi:hypothetical protein